ncbi:MAG TPA: alpha/beta hydrolase [Bryobacteraceae bacterium]|nr:alpha/beta hydrolase [Bryobacteraceae bacterium]
MLKPVLAVLIASVAFAQTETRLLWSNGAPGALGNADADKPSIMVYPAPAATANGSAVVVCPGGGYQGLAMDHEGKQIAEWLNAHGVAAFVLKYRLGPKYHHPIEMGDVQRAIRTVRAGAGEFRIKPDRIGVWGFSAGGHLASTAATHFTPGDAASSDPVERVSSRPDFAILCYPVISMGEFTHQGSRLNLLGEDPEPQLIEELSNEKQVRPETPPTFLFHTTDDSAVPVENSVMFYMALRRYGIPAEMHLYAHGPHGVGLAQKDPVLSTWPARLEDWLKGRGLLGK